MFLNDKMLVVDVEATCWENLIPPPGEQQEIIEIGLCLLDLQTYELSDTASLLVKPTRSKVSPFCTELTSLTPEQVNSGGTFDAACAVLREIYFSEQRLWGSWGDYDRQIFTSQCGSFCVPYPFSKQHINIKVLFSEVKRKPRMGMLSALRSLYITPKGIPHRGDDDAWNIGLIMQTLLHEYGKTILQGLD